MSWSGTDADGSLTTTPALIVVTYIDAQDEVCNSLTCSLYDKLIYKLSAKFLKRQKKDEQISIFGGFECP